MKILEPLKGPIVAMTDLPERGQVCGFHFNNYREAIFSTSRGRVRKGLIESVNIQRLCFLSARAHADPVVVLAESN